ncbi:MAG: hypothetical protein KGS45_02975 [Planctomycetes bacterium]|nr:hypothetical protein [Planctomycetota bacterium]
MFTRLCALTLAVGGLAAISASEPPRSAPVALPAAPLPTVAPWASELPPGFAPPPTTEVITPYMQPITPPGDLSASTSHSEDPNAGPMILPTAGQDQSAATLLGAIAPPGWQPPQGPVGEPPLPGQLPPWSAENPGNSGGTIDPAACFDCVAGSIFENEPNCSNGYIDATNGGCNSNPNVFGPRLECGDSVCGTYGTYLSASGANFRDTDWYRFSVPVATNVTWTAIGSARTRVFILSATCPTNTIATAAADPCQPATVTANLPAGDYYLFVGTDAFSGVACGSRYRATVTGTPCCVTSAQPGDVLENEPSCFTGYVDAFNGGCNSTPNVFSPLACGQTVAGTYGTYLTSVGGPIRDTDWYSFTITQTSDVTWTVTGEAPTQLLLLNGVCPASIRSSASAAACTPTTLSVNALPAGTYYLFVATSSFSGVPCGSRYRATLNVSTCCQTVPQPGDAVENEPDCATGYIDATNGGCNSTPAVYGQIACGQTIAGRYGTYLTSAGQSFRDTDWYTFTLTQTSDVTLTCVGEATTRLFILNDACPTTSLGTVSGPACTTVTLTVPALPPGTYRAFVGTDVFTGVPCGSRYRVTLTSNACCSVPPFPGDVLEGEPNCTTTDAFNGGCNSSTPIYSRIPCNVVVAGTYGNPASGTRDTDWYTFTLRQRGAVRWAAIGESPTQLAIVADGCPASVLANTTMAACTVGEINIVLNPGTYRAFIATQAFSGVLCPAKYRCVLQSAVCGCPADYNGDTVLDLFDYLDFVADFAANAPNSDYNGDTVIDFFDYLDFVAAFAAGC